MAALLSEPRLAGACMVMETPTEPPEGRLADLKLARAIMGRAGNKDRGKPRGRGQAAG